MAIVEQRVDETGFYIRTGDGKEITVNSPDILSYFTTQLGVVTEQRLATRIYLKNLIVAALGDNVSYEGIDLDFNELTGAPTLLQETL